MAEEKKKYYQLLGIKEGSDFAEVEKVYHQLHSQYQKEGGENKEKFHEINQAYENLVNLEEEKKTKFKKNVSTKKKYSKSSHLKSEVLETKRVVKVTKGGRRFSFTNLSLLKDEEQKKIAFSYQGGKEMISSFRKAYHEGQKKLISYFPNPRRTIPHEILVSYKATKIIFKPAPPGSGIKAGGVLNKLFKYLEIKDVSAKIIGSSNR